MNIFVFEHVSGGGVVECLPDPDLAAQGAAMLTAILSDMVGAGLTVSTPFYNWLTAIAMWFGRFGTIIPVLAIAGSLAAKKRIGVTGGTLPTHGPLFVVLLLGTVLLVGALTYVPALALGPGVEHLMMMGAH